MKDFEGLGLNPVLARSLTNMQYTTPTPIQAQAIPIALEGRDIMGSAQTGTGKTAAFSIPLIEQLMNTERGTALVMTPTRELGKQVMEVMQQMLGPKSRIKTAFLIGGEAMHRQCQQLRQRPRLVVGTPGRINDHLERGNLDLDNTKFLVLDEMDRMLDMGFSIQIDAIVKYIPNDRQTMMFSATMPNNIIKMAEKYLINPERISVGSTINPAKNIKQEVVRIDNDKKYPELVSQLHERNGTVIIFVKTKRGADKMARKLNDDQFDAQAIHGDLQQRKRDRVIRDYRQKNFRILVATDVVARGLDVPHIEHVINYDLPQVPEDYIHRIGRTARAGAQGESLSLVTPQDGRKWNAIEQLMDPSKKSSKGSVRPRNDNKSSKYGAKKKFGGKKPWENKEGRGGSEGRRGNSEGKSFSKDSRRSRDDTRRSEGSEGKPKKSWSNKEERGGESRRSNSEGKSFNKDSRRSRDDTRRSEGSEGKPRSFNKDKKFSRDNNSGSEGRNFNKDSRDGESRNAGDKPFNKKKSFSKDSRPSEGGSFDKTKKYGGNKGKSFSKGNSFNKGGKPSHNGSKPGGNKSRRDAA